MPGPTAVTRNPSPTQVNSVADRTDAAPARTREAAAVAAPAGNSFGMRLAAGGKASILERTKKQDQWVEKYGFGPYFGDHSSFARLSLAEKQAELKRLTKDGVTGAPGANQLRQTSCVDWALENVVAAYEKAGRGARGREIAAIVARSYTDSNGVTHKDLKGMGGVLCRELQKDGWKALFFATDSKNPDSPGSSAREVHRGYINMAKGEKKYWVVYPYEKMRVDGFVTDYHLSEDSTGTAQMAALEKLSKIPFAVGVAKGGTHCFAMHDGIVSENHWTAGPEEKSEHIFQETPLKDWGWTSGLVMVPPGTWN